MSLLDYLFRYILFLAQTSTLLVAIAIVLGLVVSSAIRLSKTKQTRLVVRKLNKHYEKIEKTVLSAILSEKEVAQIEKERNKQKKIEEKRAKKERKKGALASDAAQKSRLFVLHFKGDIQAKQVENLREEVSAILTVAKPEDEVVLCLHSPGGVVNGYGLCASQLQRIRARDIPLTVIVDHVAASGGYLMACVATKIIAAPFAMIGSIGVLMQLPNLNRLLKKHDIDFEMVTAGEYKRTLTLFGENSDDARQKVQEEVDDIHLLFKAFIANSRPELDVEQVATGEVWFGEQAKALNLIDEISTSDDYLMEKSKASDLYEVVRVTKPKPFEQLTGAVSSMAKRTLARLLSPSHSDWS